MQVIYEPGGRAREFAALAANLYRGCAHGCLYCYAPQVIKLKREEFVSGVRPRKKVFKYLEKGAKRFKGDHREILLSLTSYPECRFGTTLVFTREADAQKLEPAAASIFLQPASWAPRFSHISQVRPGSPG